MNPELIMKLLAMLNMGNNGGEQGTGDSMQGMLGRMGGNKSMTGNQSSGNRYQSWLNNPPMLGRTR